MASWPGRGAADAACTAAAITLTGSRASSDEVVVGVAGGQVEVRPPDPLVELHGLALDPVALGEPAQPVVGLEVEDDGQVRPQVVGRPARDVLDLGELERAAGALVGEHRVDVAVGDDDLAAVERGLDDAVHVLGLVGGVEQGLGAVGQLAGRRVEHDLADPDADLGVAGLERQPDDVPLGLQPLRPARAPGSTCRSRRRPRSRRRRRRWCRGTWCARRYPGAPTSPRRGHRSGDGDRLAAGDELPVDGREVGGVDLPVGDDPVDEQLPDLDLRL